MVQPSVKRLYRSRENRMVAGVCGGLGEYLDIDPTLVRLGWVLFTLAAGAGILAYMLAVIIIPEKPFGETGTQPVRVKTPRVGELLLVLFGLLILLIGFTQLFGELGLVSWTVWSLLAALRYVGIVFLIAVGLILIIVGLSRTR